MKINTNKLVYKLFASMLILVLFTTWLMSGLLAKYTSGNSASGESEVALWKIDAINDTGEETTVGVNLRKRLAGGESGSWYFGIKNESDVNAMIDQNSLITIKITNGPFTSIEERNFWDFLGESTTNPITLKVDLINQDIDTIVSYKYGTETLTASEYNEKTETEKANYTKVITEPTGTVVNVAVTKDELELKKGLDQETGLVYYYIEFKFDSISDKLEEIDDSLNVNDFLSFGIKNDTGYQNKTIKLSWEIKQYTSSESNNDIDENKFNVYEITDQVVNDTSYKCGPFENIEYVKNGQEVTEDLYIKKTSLIFTDYFLFSGEPMFTIGSMRKLYSEVKVNESYLEMVQSRLTDDFINGIDTYEELRLYNEALAYAQYESFNEIYSEFAASQGYIQCGLSLSVVFDLKVVQVD